ncbi:MAG: flagellar protein FlaG [Nitrospiraceae bacterium]|nr:flagellar protein FlaG [Nitrospiraceae bacterium]
MVQHIRPPQDFYVAQRRSESEAQSVHGKDSRVEADRGTPASVSPPTRDDVEQAVARLKEAFRGTTSHLEFDIDPDLDKVVIKILSGDSGEIIRQIPAQELLDLAKHLDGPKGVLVRERA